MHAPGSPFKILVGISALQEKAITEKTTIFCNNYYQYGKEKRKMQCHCGGGYRNLNSAISLSCNSYFANAYRKTIDTKLSTEESFDNWSNQMKSFGLGEYLNNDLSVGKKGIIPDFEFYDSWYPDFKWGATTTLSNAIGQGEVLVTPIQLANMTAVIANKGFYYTPHIIKKIEGSAIEPKFNIRKYSLIDSVHYEPIIKGLSEVYKTGTAKFLQVPGIEICGKTGTSENFTKIDGTKTQLTDHSIFIAFAPKDNPTIAISVLVENGYYGSRWAGRIASLMIEKYIKGEVTLKRMEKLVIEKSLANEYEKPFLNKPFKINQ
jgi:penicillin-binding protein 2